MLIVKLIIALIYIIKHGCALLCEPKRIEGEGQPYRVSNTSSKLEHVYKLYQPFLASNLKDEYRKYINQIGQSSIVPKGLKSIMFTGAKKSLEMSKIHKESIAQNLKRDRQL